MTHSIAASMEAVRHDFPTCSLRLPMRAEAAGAPASSMAAQRSPEEFRPALSPRRHECRVCREQIAGMKTRKGSAAPVRASSQRSLAICKLVSGSLFPKSMMMVRAHQLLCQSRPRPERQQCGPYREFTHRPRSAATAANRISTASQGLAFASRKRWPTICGGLQASPCRPCPCPQRVSGTFAPRRASAAARCRAPEAWTSGSLVMSRTQRIAGVPNRTTQSDPYCWADR